MNMDDIPIMISEDLEFNVTRRIEVLLNKYITIAEIVLCLP